MFKKIFLLALLLVWLTVDKVSGEILEYKINEKTFLKLYVVKEYPEKDRFYVKEPFRVRFTIGLLKSENRKVKENIKKILNSIDIKTLISERTVVTDIKKKISGNRVLVDYVVYFLRNYDTDMPFLITFKTDELKGLIPEDLLVRLKDGFIVKSESYYRILPVPKDILYVGNFKMKTEFEDYGGYGTFSIIIEGVGFPYLPKYSLVVKNGSAKKIEHIFEHKLDFVKSVQKYKVIYMDELQIKPIKFRYFDPLEEKIIEFKTDAYVKKDIKKQVESFWESLSDEEKLSYYLSRFKDLYPEFFSEESKFEKFFITLYVHKNSILTVLIFFIFLVLLIVLRFGKYIFPKEIRELACLRGNQIRDYKLLYTTIAKDYYSYRDKLRNLDIFLYRSQWITEGNKLNYIIYNNEKIYPNQIKDYLKNTVKEIITVKISDLSKWRLFLSKLIFLLRSHIDLILLTGFLLILTLIYFVMIEKLPNFKNVFNFLFFAILVISIYVSYILSKPKIRIK
ncbi:hypothetical protein [Persephonella sp.]